jgi:hypothetical protein
MEPDVVVLKVCWALEEIGKKQRQANIAHVAKTTFFIGRERNKRSIFIID